MNDTQRQALTALLETEPSSEEWDDIEAQIAEKQMANKPADASLDDEFSALVESVELCEFTPLVAES